jgi:hypothetical protein
LGGSAGTVFVHDANQRFFFDHRPLQFVFDNLVGNQCTVPTSVQTVVKDPDDNVVPSGSNLTTGTTGFAVDVSFDAGAAGWYFIESNVEPNLGLLEAQLLVLQDRQQAPLASLAFNDDCETLDRTAGGIWVCTPQGHADAGTTSQVIGANARAFGSSVWAYDPGLGSPAIALYGEDAGSLIPQDRLPQPALFTVDGLAASAQGLVAGSGSQLLWFSQDGGHIVAGGSTVIPELQGAMMIALEGTTVLVAGTPSGGFDAGDCAGLPISTQCPGGFTGCAVAFGGTAPPPAACQPVTGQALGTDGALLWAFNAASGRMSAYGSDGGAFAFFASAPLSANLVAGQANSFIVEIEPTDVPNTVKGIVAPTVEGLDVAYAFYDPLPGQLSGVGQSFVWEPNPDGSPGIKVFSR